MRELCLRCRIRYAKRVLEDVPLCFSCFQEWNLGLISVGELQDLNEGLREGG